MKAFEKILFAACLFFPLQGFTEWRTVNRNDTLRPLECSYRILSSLPVPGGEGASEYYVYRGENFSQSDNRFLERQTIELNFSVSAPHERGLAGLLSPADRSEFNDLLANYDLRCTLTFNGVYAKQRRNRNSTEVSATLICGYSAQSGDIALDLTALYQLDLNRLVLQQDC